ncbi:MAG: catalase-peroxidase [Myxococcota bacterium]|jgi:catalase-peroxidase
MSKRAPLRTATARAAQSSGKAPWVALISGSNAQLRALTEVHACDDAGERLVNDFVAVWTKVMDLDRFDVA